MNQFIRIWLYIFFVILALTRCLSASGQYRNDENPIANKQAVVAQNNVRFTILTPSLVRLEWDSVANYVDNATFFAVNRNLSVPEYHQKIEDGWLCISTQELTIKYKLGSGKFNAQNLFVSSNNRSFNEWKPGTLQTGNLKGTCRTLDGADGAYYGGKTLIPLEDGLLARDGWSFVDDSRNFQFDHSEWPWVLPRTAESRQDWYFFGYGINNYRKALGDFIQVAGRIPIPPKYVFGYWWSRYWNYSDREIKSIINTFEKNDIPLDVFVLDMDWHKTDGLVSVNGPLDEFGQNIGWTGYTWNKDLFPEPKKLIEWINSKQIHPTMNLHPASGIPSTEEKYNQMATVLNFNTKEKGAIPFEVSNKRFMSALFDYVLEPMEQWGIDFWWLDWQQWRYSRAIPDLNNTWYLNYLFFSHSAKNGKRPLLYHRWGGLGNHRYQIGFSGDVASSWQSLAYQPQFTATASNVGYGYWSHDIGGHFPTQSDFDYELYTRWVQFGVFSPVLRTHSTKNGGFKKEPWSLPYKYNQAVIEAIRLRYALFPYIYNAARNAYDTGVSICHPMYYDYPTKEEAYCAKDQYMFGDNLLVAPVITPAKEESAQTKVWLPAGTWIEWFTGTVLRGENTYNRKFMINEIPVYVKAGSVIPMLPPVKNLDSCNSDYYLLKIFPYGHSSASIYEDDGHTDKYRKGDYNIIKVSNEQKDNIWELRISPCTGKYCKGHKKYELLFTSFWMPDKIQINGKEVTASSGKKIKYYYEGENLTFHLILDNVSLDKETDVKLYYSDSLIKNQNRLNGFIGLENRLREALNITKDNWTDGAPIPSIFTYTESIPERITYHPDQSFELIKEYNYNMTHMLKCVDKLLYINKESLIKIRALLSLDK